MGITNINPQTSSLLCFCCCTASLLPDMFSPLNVLIISSGLVSSLMCLEKLFWIFNVNSHIFALIHFLLTLQFQSWEASVFPCIQHLEEPYFRPRPSLACILSHFLLVSAGHQLRPEPQVSPDKCLFSGTVQISQALGQGFTSCTFKALAVVCQVWNRHSLIWNRDSQEDWLLTKWGGPDRKVWFGFQDG